MMDDCMHGILKASVKEGGGVFLPELVGGPEMHVDDRDGFSWGMTQSPRDVLSTTEGFSWSPGFAPEGDIKGRFQQCINAQAEAGAWLRDEPMDVASHFGFYASPSPQSSPASKERDGSEEIEVQGLVNASDLSEDSFSQEQQLLSIPASLYKQLRSTKIKESVIRDAIRRHGGGQKGLRGVVKAIMCWLMAKNRHSSQSSTDHSILIPSQSLSSPPTEEADQVEWYGNELSPGVSSGFQHGTISADCSFDLPAYLGSMMHPPREESGNLSELLSGNASSGDYSSEVPSSNSSPQTLLGDSERSGWAAGMRSQQSCLRQADMTSGNWMDATGAYSPQDLASGSGIRKRSPSPHFHDTGAGDDDNLSQKSKLRRQSSAPARYGFSQNGMEASVYGSSPSRADGSGNSFAASGHLEPIPFNAGALFSFCPLSPSLGDSGSQDLASFELPAPILIDENLACVGAAGSGCSLLKRSGSTGYPPPTDTSAARKKEVRKFGAGHSQVKDSPAACTRLARKTKMDRNRKAASAQAHRNGGESIAVASGKGKDVWSNSSRASSRSQTAPVVQVPASKIKDRKDREHLQFLLQKILRPSDVGNLGRVVLPKKDAESHLPWLGAKEKFQFACEDYDTADKMMLRYRFWPNNDSRMYVLENTGEFVRRHKLQESDKMLIYKDLQQDIFIIRARKARDCGEVLTPEMRSKPVVAEKKKVGTAPHSPGTTSCSGTTSANTGGRIPSCTSIPKLESSEESAGNALPVRVATSQNDLLDFTDLPVVPMGEGTESLVRFPSLEPYYVESLDLCPAAGKQQDLSPTAIVVDRT